MTDTLSLFDLDLEPARVHVCPTCNGSGQVTAYGPVHSAPARATDPDTSSDAAYHEEDLRRFSSRSRQARLLAVIADMPRTAIEAAACIVPERPVSAFEGCRRRVSDLHAADMVKDSGQRRANPGSGDLSIVWEITDSGKVALEHLRATGWSR